uniref:Uncharacterized protein n=1 Tax=Rhizophora mucronata TaxID=61149 RepID=A0A2P2N7C8_RHIMU
MKIRWHIPITPRQMQEQGIPHQCVQRPQRKSSKNRWAWPF